MGKILLIAAGGALGAVMRYWVAGAGQRFWGGAFPFGTFCVNVLGCFAIGLLGAVFVGPVLVREDLRRLVMVGFLGGFTTYSTYALESFTLMNDGQFRLAAANVVLSNVVGLVAVWIGYRLGELW